MQLAINKFGTPMVRGGGTVARKTLNQSRNLVGMGSANRGVRSMHTDAGPGKSLADRARPSGAPDAGRTRQYLTALWNAIKFDRYKSETKTVIDADKLGYTSGSITEHSYGIATLEKAAKSAYLDVKGKLEAKALQVNVGTGRVTSLEVHAGKATAQTEVGVKSLHQTGQVRINVTLGKTAGYFFISVKDLIANALKESGEQGEPSLPTLKNLRAQPLKTTFTGQIELRDLQNGTLTMPKFNLAYVLDVYNGELKEGETFDPTKLVTRETKTFDPKLHQTYQDLGREFARVFKELQEQGVMDKIDASFEDALGDWRSDGEGYHPDTLATFKLDAFKSQVMASVLGLKLENADAVPIFRLADRYHREFVLSPPTHGNNAL
ncbi:hypothetical protein [Bordetella genomosp. 5]|uniref:Uncharacterized protein n=1 Tax=Bordetella genomosp. 5 TaxID=1395608 RepID=A0A261TAL4_9BORD|nr:hypothetical protein [Bordetella genomosp. 5]OZI46639.1 hypothetical protein CAL25_18250 [Bordetella genomosp. 5]